MSKPQSRSATDDQRPRWQPAQQARTSGLEVHRVRNAAEADLARSIVVKRVFCRQHGTPELS
jgi:hypothetical protein